MGVAIGKVTALDGAYALVEIEPESGCGRCYESGGCGGANISRMACSSAPRSWRVLNPRGALVGETVTVAIAEGAVGMGASIVYVVPLAALITGAVLGANLGADTGAMIGAGAGLIAGGIGMRRLQRRGLEDPRFQPHIL